MICCGVAKLLVLITFLGIELVSSMDTTCKYKFYPGYTNTTVCDHIYEEENGWWLPEAYIYNAKCACLTIPTDSDSANCIREFLHRRLLDPQIYTEEFKLKMAGLKRHYLRDSDKLSDPYHRFILDKFTPLIYQDHFDAYKQCC